MQAQELAERMFADMMSSAGVGVGRISQELLFFIPKHFRDMYIEMFRRALRGSDGGSDEAGRRNDAVGKLGRAAGGNTDGWGGGKGGSDERRQVRGVSGRGKKYKKFWTVDDERALRLKEKVDRRLRAIARDIEEEMASWETGREKGPQEVRKVEE